MEHDVDQFIDISGALDADLREMLGALRFPRDARGAATIRVCEVAMQHGTSQRLLLVAGLHLTAMALVRLHYESVVRALWMQVGAKEDWIQKFAGPIPEGQLSEPVLGPPVDAMLDRLAVVLPPWIASELRRLKDASWLPMNSYVHAGVRAAAHSMIALPPDKIGAVLKNANALAITNAQTYLLACNDPASAGRLSAIQTRHRGCLP
ncbi:MAG: hypothetical protein Q8R33_09520 [Burkholderiales bacterium]|nr:hypothetical protein [Burkholderiales bacterium]